ncbi:peptidase, M16 family, putative [Ketogulonicigenium vulgare Y25]|nr:peptidase, M16 family, putative [Ketogulonicigenium vulgare Y25]
MLRFILPLTLALFATTARAEVEIQEVTSPGGVNAWLVEQHEIPFLALEIRVRGGANLDEPGKRGAVNLMTAVIEEGAGERDAVAFQTAREELAASFSFSVSDDSFGVSARVLTENRDEALALLREALISPRFDQDAIDRVRAQVISGIQSQTQRPNVIASSTFNAEAFGDHPYGTALDGTIESVSALTRDDLLAAHRNVVTRDRLYVSAVASRLLATSRPRNSAPCWTICCPICPATPPRCHRMSSRRRLAGSPSCRSPARSRRSISVTRGSPATIPITSPPIS